MPNAENVTKQYTTEYGQKDQKNSENLGYTNQGLTEALDPSQELYEGPDAIALIEEKNAEAESFLDELNYTRDILYNSKLLELNKKNPTINISKIKSMVCLDKEIIEVDKKILITKKKQRAIRVLLNKQLNRFIAARRLFFHQ